MAYVINGNTVRARSGTDRIRRANGRNGSPVVEQLEQVVSALCTAQKRADSGNYSRAYDLAWSILDNYPQNVSKSALRRAAAGSPLSWKELTLDAIKSRINSYFYSIFQG